MAKTFESDREAHTLLRGQLAYLRGDISGVAKHLKELPYDEKRPDLLIGTAFLHSLYALYQGNTAEWLSAKDKIANIICLCESEAARRDFWLGNIDLELYNINGFPDWFGEGDFESLPSDCTRWLGMLYKYICYAP